MADWRMDVEIRQRSPNTLANRRVATEKLLGFLRKRGCERCGVVELRSFLVYLLDTGARASEVCALRRCDLDLAGRRIGRLQRRARGATHEDMPGVVLGALRP